MLMLIYPFVLECGECGTEATVTRTEVRGMDPNPDSITATDEVF
jgi:hypothetical protein